MDEWSYTKPSAVQLLEMRSKQLSMANLSVWMPESSWQVARKGFL